MVVAVDIGKIHPDPSNPRKSDDARLHLLRLSLQKLGFIQPIFVRPDGLILSGHQRYKVAVDLGIKVIPVEYADLTDKQSKGINVLFNRATNDFTAFDTGSNSLQNLEIADLMAQAEAMPDFDSEDFLAYNVETVSIEDLGSSVVDEYNRKSMLVAATLRRYGVRIPIVISESGQIVNGVHRLFEARHEGIKEWPVVTIPDEFATLALNMLNYLSMDYEVNGEFAQMLRYSAYRRPQNARGILPKGMRFWAAGERTLRDSEAYSTKFWETFRDLHGKYILDFGAGLCKVADFLETKGIECVEFEPYRLNPRAEHSRPDPDYSRLKAEEFLDEIEKGKQFDSIFLASVMNSIPFPRDRQCVLAIVHALSSFETITYGTCRDISDFLYEYSGIRNATYFVFDSEPGVRLGDALSNPKIQKFHTQEEFKAAAGYFWNQVDTWKGGNIFYWRASAPKRLNTKTLVSALEFEFDLPYADGSSMGLVERAVEAFSARLGVNLRKKR